MKDGAKVPLERTATPVELDQVYGALDELSAALGPNGANKNGALSDLVDVGAANLDGNGEALNRTLTGFSQAVETLSDHRDDLFSSLDNLQTFTSRAGHHRRAGGRSSTTTWRRWPTSSPRSGRTSPRRSQLLNKALADVAGFVQDNTHAADHERQPARRRHARAGAAAAGPGRGARRRAGRAGQPRRTPTTPTTARSTPATTRWAPPRRRSSSARSWPRPAG